MDQNNKAYHINPSLQKQDRSIKSIDYYLKGLSQSNIVVLSEVITLIESDDEVKQKMALQILSSLSSPKVPTQRIAVTGAPGVGKSTFIEHFGNYLLTKGRKLAILAIDPSSHFSGGSILGDKTRMEQLASNDHVFIRPSSAGEVLGGISKGTKDSVSLCEAAGFDTILIETVGVGQSEYLASMLCDITLLLIQSGAGDDLQGIKRGILEAADLIIVHKADQENVVAAIQTQKDYRSVSKLFTKEDKDESPVLLCSSIENTGFEEIYDTILNIYKKWTHTNKLQTYRLKQEKFWFNQVIIERLIKMISQQNSISNIIGDFENNLSNDIKLNYKNLENCMNAIKSKIKTID